MRGELARPRRRASDVDIVAAPPLLSVVDVSKSFGPTQALRGVSLDLVAGEIHALVGENGAGKSTLIKVMTGLYRPDAGHLAIDGEHVELRNPADAQSIGIACIYQEPLVFPDLTVSENIFMAGGRTGGGRARALARHARPGRRDPAPARGRHRSAHGRLAAHGGRSAGGRDRQGDVPPGPRPDHGRTDRGAVGPRGAPAVPAGAPAGGVRGGDPVREPPARRGVRAQRPDHGPARRPAHLDQAGRRGHGGVPDPRHGRTRAVRLLPSRPPRTRRRRAERRGPRERGRVRGHQLRGPGR